MANNDEEREILPNIANFNKIEEGLFLGMYIFI